jgi:predicted Zn-dependent protease
LLVPGLWKVWARRIQRAWARGDDASAAEIAAKYVGLRPTDPKGWDLWVQALLKARRPGEAEAAAREGLERHPEDLWLRYWVGHLLCARHEFVEARSLFEDLLKHSSSPLPHLGLAYVAQFGEKDPAKAKRFIEEADERAGGTPRLWMDFGWVLIQDTDTRPQGIEILRRTLEAFPEEPTVHLLLSVLLEDSDPAGAINHVDRARGTWRERDVTPEEEAEFLRERLQSGRSEPPWLGR